MFNTMPQALREVYFGKADNDENKKAYGLVAAHKAEIVMMIDKTVDHVLAEFCLELGTLGLLVDDRFAFLILNEGRIELECHETVFIGINQRVPHCLDVNLLTHAAVVHVFIELLSLDAACQRPGFGLIARFLIGECRFEPVKCLVVAVHCHCQASDIFLGLTD